MKIEASVSLQNIAPVVNVKHGNAAENNEKILSFSISHYRRNRFSAGFDVFSQINEYWSDQPPDVQQKIFDIYFDIFNAFSVIFNKDVLKEHLRKKVKELLSYHDLEKVSDWIAFRSHDIRLPASIPQLYVADVDRNTSIGKTYIAEDYRRLTAFAFVLRCLIPIWGEYIFSIKQTVDDSFKEMQAFQLVDQVFTEDLPVIKKLKDYIENMINSANMTRPMAVFFGIPSADYPRWLLSLVTINCLSIGDIRGIDPNAHLVTYTHMYIGQRVSPKDDLGDSKIKEKELSEELADENQAKASALERYKVKADVSIGDIVELEYFLFDIHKVANYLQMGITRDEVEKALERIKEYEGQPTVPQITLLRVVFSTIISHKGLLYMPENIIKPLLAVLELVLWNRGQKYLAVLATCYPITSETEMVVSPVDSKQRIPDPLIEKLDLLFPFRRSQRNKRAAVKDSNLAMDSIDIWTNDFMMYGWRPTAEPHRVEQALGWKTSRYPIKPDIKTYLAQIVIDLETNRAVQDYSTV